MLSFTHLGVFPIVAVLLLVSAVASAGQPADPTDAPAPTAIVPLEPVGTAGVRGRTMIAPDPNVPGRTAVVIEAEGLQPGGAHPVHLHAGSPTRPSAGFGLLGELVADATGRARLETGDMAASAIGETMALELELLGDGDHGHSGRMDLEEVIAVAQITPGRSDAPPASGGPTALDAVDAVIVAVQSGDVERLVGRARMRSLPCGPDTPEGFALAPPCELDEAEGSPVAIFPAAACEVYWPRDPRPVLRGVVEQAGPPYGVVRTPADRPANSLFPTSEYLVVFEPKPDSHVFGLGLCIEGESVVAVEAGCRGPRSLMHFDEEPLPVVWRASAR